MRRSDLALVAALGLLVPAALVTAGDARAYCRTTSCGDKGTGARCIPATASDCGTSLFWAGPCVGFSVQQDGSNDVTFATTESIVKTAFKAWTSAACPAGGKPHVAVVELAAAVCKAHEYNQEKGNTNLIVYRQTAWPYPGAENQLALTTVTYNLETGEIYDADMELNSADYHFTTSDAAVEYDLLSIITHETGHFLGMGHSATSDATMFPDYKPGDLGLRDLSPDDVSGICAIYPPGAAIPSSCDATPRHGFSVECGADQPASTTSSSGGSSGGGCALGEGDSTRGLGVVALLGALGLGARLRERRRRR